MVADLVKDLRSDLIAKAIKRYGLNKSEATRFVDNFPNESTWPDAEATAESLGVGIEEVEDDDVENYMEMGGNKGEIESSIGPIQWAYDNKLKAYLIYMVLETSKGPKDIMYKLDPIMMKEWKSFAVDGSSGEYYNKFIKGNSDIEDSEFSCGCNPNPCEPQQVDRFKQKFSSIS